MAKTSEEPPRPPRRRRPPTEPAKATKATKAAKTAKATKATKAAKAVKAAKEPAKATRPRPPRPAKKAAAEVDRAPLPVPAETTNDGGPAAPSSGHGGVAGAGESGAPSWPPSRWPPRRLSACPSGGPAPAAPSTGGSRANRQRRPGESAQPTPPVAVNDPLTFLTFVTEHPLGSTVQGTVSSYVSHGAMVDVDGMLCYLPLTGLGDPPPRRAREVLDRGEKGLFVVVALDPPRRGAELALPGLARLPTTNSREFRHRVKAAGDEIPRRADIKTTNSG